MTRTIIVIPRHNSSRSVGETKLSTSVTVDKYKQFEEQENKQAIAAFIVERFDERCFNPVMNSPSKHGFTMMAVGCLAIEALESLYQGWHFSNDKKPFKKFLERQKAQGRPLGVFANHEIKFHDNIRNGILHQAETKGGWKVRRAGLLLDLNARSINADCFIRELRKTVAEYASQLQVDPDPALWKNFKKKMKRVCENCEPDVAAVVNQP